MHIGMLLSQLEVTGAETYAAALADELIQRGHHVTIISDTFSTHTKASYISIPLNKRNIFFRVKHLYLLQKIIKEKKIDIIHTHSRASNWLGSIIFRFFGIPYITTIHGIQKKHVSRNFIRALGTYAIAICEEIKEHIVFDLDGKASKVTLIRNGFDINSFAEIRKSTTLTENRRSKIVVIGRLSGKKGIVISHLIKECLTHFQNCDIEIVGGNKNLPEYDEMKKNAQPNIYFLGFQKDIIPLIQNADLVIGSGRVAVTSLLLGKKTFAIGEACSVGLIDSTTLKYGLETNFGDILRKNNHKNYLAFFHFKKIRAALQNALKASFDSSLIPILEKEYNLISICNAIEKMYAKAFFSKKTKEVPILMYHRIVKNKKDAGRHGIWVTEEQFNLQLEYLKKKNFIGITMSEYAQLSFDEKQNNKYVIITFDDGYSDNYKLAFPLLKKYGFKATIFLVTDKPTNSWDADEPQVKLLSHDEILEMNTYGIEFGSHTLSHPKLSELSPLEAKKEVFESKKKIEKILGKEIHTFCYPYGIITSDAKKFTKEAGYKYALATYSGPFCIDADLFEVRRIGVFPKTSLRSFARKVSGKYNSRYISKSRT